MHCVSCVTQRTGDLSEMKITILGSGTSMGVPTLTCDCDVCLSEDPHDKRLRSGVWIQAHGKSILIDVSIDFRQQALANRINDVDAVLITHTHSDHVLGIDDLRIYNMRYKKRIDFYGSSEHLDEIRRRFDYSFNPTQLGGGVPQIDLSPVDAPFDLLGLRVVPIPAKHGDLDVFGYRIGAFGYVTDASYVSDESVDLLRGVDTLIINALKRTSHSTHFSLPEALEISQRVGARQTWFVHMCHDLGHAETNAGLPDDAQLAYDGLSFEADSGD